MAKSRNPIGVLSFHDLLAFLRWIDFRSSQSGNPGNPDCAGMLPRPAILFFTVLCFMSWLNIREYGFLCVNFVSQYPYHPHASRMVPSGKFPSSSRKRESVTLRAIQYRSLTVMRISRSVEPRAYSSFRFIFSGCCICIYTQGWF